jgi:hypothetical protein
MTGPQKDWLDSHRAAGYRPLGKPPGAVQVARFVKIGALYPDGSFELKLSHGHRYSKIEAGMFEVGVLEVI